MEGWLSAEPSGEALTRLAMARPSTVLLWCDTGWNRLRGAVGASHVWQARGLAARESGDAGAAVRYLRRSVSCADRDGSPDRAADTRASLATTLALVGRPDEAERLLAEAEQLAGPDLRPRVQMRRGAVLGLLGRHEDAVDVLGRAIRSLRASGDVLWEARALNNRAIAHLDLGAPHRAEHDTARSRELYARTDQGLEAASATHNLGFVAYRTGALPEALERLAEADELYALAGDAAPSLAMDRCVVLLAAGLYDEAYRQIDDCIAGFSGHDSRTGLYAEALLVGARAAIAARRPARAVEHAARAERLFRRQGNVRAARLARLESVRARWTAGAATAALSRRADELADELTASGAPEAVDALLLAGRVALTVGRTDAAMVRLRRAAGARNRGPALARTTGWLAQELAEEAGGSGTGVVRAARAGLRVLDEHRLSLGATELRAHATSHGTVVGAGALRQVVRGSDARRLLVWTERWRGVTVDEPPTRPPETVELLADLGELREVTRELTLGSIDAAAAEALGRRQRRLEQAVLARSRQARGTGTGERYEPFDVAALELALAGRQLVSLVDVDGTLHAVLVGGGRVRGFRLGPAADAAREVEFARFGLRTVVLGRGGAVASRRLDSAGALLEATLLGPVAAALDDGPLVLVPPTRLQATPWAVLPALRDRAFSVAPSARAWVRAARTPPPVRHKVVLVRGPGLASDGAEVPVLERLHGGAVVLESSAATVGATLTQLDGAWLAHVAAHGTFRQDNPMFSALHLYDGPLTIHDLERLRRTPHRLVLSACDAGLGASVGSDELLGLVNALMTLGSAGVLASVLPVADTSVVDLSVDVHRGLLAGQDLATALRDARRRTLDDPVAGATASAFLAFGAA